MTNIRFHTIPALGALALLVVAAWPPGASAVNEPGKKAANGASRLEPIQGEKLSRVVLTQKAAQRLDIRTSEIKAESGKLIAPYAALIYDVSGAAWVYTNPSPLAYLRQPVVVESIAGSNAYLAKGPAAGTQVVTVGASELYGAESGVGH